MSTRVFLSKFPGVTASWRDRTDQHLDCARTRMRTRLMSGWPSREARRRIPDARMMRAPRRQADAARPVRRTPIPGGQPVFLAIARPKSPRGDRPVGGLSGETDREGLLARRFLPQGPAWRNGRPPCFRPFLGECRRISEGRALSSTDANAGSAMTGSRTEAMQHLAGNPPAAGTSPGKTPVSPGSDNGLAAASGLLRRGTGRMTASGGIRGGGE